MIKIINFHIEVVLEIKIIGGRNRLEFGQFY